MNINAQRQIVTGVAGEGVRVGTYTQDGNVPLTLINPNAGNGPCWTGNRILLADFSRGLGTCAIDGSDFQPLAGAATSYGCNDPGLPAEWAKYLADGHTGVTSSWGLSLPDRAWLGMGPALFVKPDSGDSIECYDINAMTPRWTQPGVTIDFFAVDADAVIWTDGARRLQVRDLPEPAQNEPIFSPSTFVAVGRRWLVYGRQNGGLFIRPWDDDTQGFIVIPEGQASFAPTVIQGDDTDHVIAFSSPTSSETIIVARTVDLTAAMVPLDPPIVVPSFRYPVSPGVVFPSK